MSNSSNVTDESIATINNTTNATVVVNNTNVTLTSPLLNETASTNTTNSTAVETTTTTNTTNNVVGGNATNTTIPLTTNHSDSVLLSGRVCPPPQVASLRELEYYCHGGIGHSHDRDEYSCILTNGTRCTGILNESMPIPPCPHTLSTCIDSEYFSVCHKPASTHYTKHCGHHRQYTCWDKRDNYFCQDTLTPQRGTQDEPYCPYNITTCDELQAYGWDPHKDCTCANDGALGWFNCNLNDTYGCSGGILKVHSAAYNGTCPPPVSNECVTDCLSPLQSLNCFQVSDDDATTRLGLYGCTLHHQLVCVGEIRSDFTAAPSYLAPSMIPSAVPSQATQRPSVTASPSITAAPSPLATDTPSATKTAAPHREHHHKSSLSPHISHHPKKSNHTGLGHAKPPPQSSSPPKSSGNIVGIVFGLVVFGSVVLLVYRRWKRRRVLGQPMMDPTGNYQYGLELSESTVTPREQPPGGYRGFV